MVLDRDLEYHLFPDLDHDHDHDFDHDLDHDHDQDLDTDLDTDLGPKLKMAVVDSSAVFICWTLTVFMCRHSDSFLGYGGVCAPTPYWGNSAGHFWLVGRGCSITHASTTAPRPMTTSLSWG